MLKAFAQAAVNAFFLLLNKPTAQSADRTPRTRLKPSTGLLQPHLMGCFKTRADADSFARCRQPISTHFNGRVTVGSAACRL
jgi:hypothetical protein